MDGFGLINTIITYIQTGMAQIPTKRKRKTIKQKTGKKWKESTQNKFFLNDVLNLFK